MSRAKPVERVDVRLDFGTHSRSVGALAYNRQGTLLLLEWDPEFAADPLPISPLQFPPGVLRLQASKMANRQDERALWGVFQDSLPDDFGRAALELDIRKLGIDGRGSLDLLAAMGTRALGALTYHPNRDVSDPAASIELGVLAQSAESLYAGRPAEVLDNLRGAMISAGGARPKVAVGITEHGMIVPDLGDIPAGAARWLIKFFGRDGIHSGVIEHCLTVMAGQVGITVPKTQVLTAASGDRYFATRRFDRNDGQRRHQHTFGGLAFRREIGVADYAELLGVAKQIARRRQMALTGFRHMLFNIAIGNTDDHSKNFSFLMDERGEWSWSPAYDLTQASRQDHVLLVAGASRGIGWDQCLAVARVVDFSPAEADELLAQVRAVVTLWPSIASDNDLPADVAAKIGDNIKANVQLLLT
jgi:serine/threonine-protein kinase HipA